MVTDARVAGIVTTPAGTPNNNSQRPTRERVKLREQVMAGPTPTSTAVFPHLGKTGKRAVYRAVRRARLHGSTQYQGRTHTTQTLGIPVDAEPDTPFRSSTAFARPQRPPSTTSRWRLVTWNAGGLSSAKLLEVQTWLKQCRAMGSPVHLCFIQETHWSLESEWQTEDHFMIHSGNSNRKAGILIMIDRSFANAQAIRTHAHIPGRMVYRPELIQSPPLLPLLSTNMCGETPLAPT